jgi:hypothetical protein
LSMIPLIQGLRTVPKIEEQPADPLGESMLGEDAAADSKAAPQSA